MLPGNVGLDNSDFDISQIPFCFETDASVTESELDEHFRLHEEAWLQTGICPDPHMYEVHGSLWLKELLSKGTYLGKGQMKLKHYLIQGVSRKVEVIARGWRWESRPRRKLPG
jgi:hypothetical protein